MIDSIAKAGVPAPSDPTDPTDATDAKLAVNHFSTDTIHVSDRHGAWAARGFPSISALFESIPLGVFNTSASWVNVDGLVLQYATGTARLLDRTAARIAADGVAMLGVGIQFDAALTGEAGDAGFVSEPGGILLLDMTLPSRVELPAGRSIQIGISRHRAEREFGPVANLHGITIPPARAALLTSHLLLLREQLTDLAQLQQARVARTIMDLLALLLDDASQLPASDGGGGGEPLASKARREIELALGSSDLTIARLVDRLGVSRAALYREFQAEGGVQAYIRHRRLEMVRASLLDPDNRVRISDLAYRWGFCDATHLSRVFRQAYGASPRAFRERAAGARG